MRRLLVLVERGEIVAATRSAVPRHRTVDLPVTAAAALLRLRRDGLISYGARDRQDGWLPAELTSAGRVLLASTS